MITNEQIIRESLEDLQNPKHRDEALENLIMIMTENAVRDQKEDIFDIACDIDKALALVDVLYNDYFSSAEPSDKVMRDISVRYGHISKFLSLCVCLLHDSIESFKEMDMY